MKDDAFTAIMALHMSFLQVKLQVIEDLLRESGLSSAEGLAARTEQALTQSLPALVAETQSQTAGLLRAMEQRGLTIDAVIRLLLRRKGQWEFPSSPE